MPISRYRGMKNTKTRNKNVISIVWHMGTYAKFLEKFFSKGDMVLVEGKLLSVKMMITDMKNGPISCT